MNTRQLAMFASFSTLDYVLSFIPFMSMLVGYLTLPMFRILMGWRLTIWWLVLGFVTYLPNLIQNSSAAASTVPVVATNSIHIKGLWVPYLSPFVGFLQYESGLIPAEVKALIIVPATLYFYQRTWKYQIRNAKRILLQIPQLKSWGYFDKSDIEDYNRYLEKQSRLKSLKGWAHFKATMKD